jgi:hypothetical protein
MGVCRSRRKREDIAKFLCVLGCFPVYGPISPAKECNNISLISYEMLSAQPPLRTSSRLLVQVPTYRGRVLILIRDPWRHIATVDSARQIRRAIES